MATAQLSMLQGLDFERAKSNAPLLWNPLRYVSFSKAHVLADRESNESGQAYFPVSEH